MSRSAKSYRAVPRVEILEARLALHADPSGGHDHEDHEPDFLPAWEGAAGDSSGGPAVAVGALPVSASYSSRPGAPATLYLDFDGHFEAVWGGYSNLNTPAYDTDGNPNSWSAAELDAIYQIWRQVAEDYAPFNINVTTVLPPSFGNGVAQRVVIGGTGAWTGGTYGGVSYVNNFTSSVANTSFVFSANLGNGYPKYVAEAASHEAGHAFGLSHQSGYNGSTKVTDYQSGPGDGTAPIMGNSYSAARGLWWYGTSSSATTFQNDMAVIASAANGFGYRPDEAGDTPAAAAALTVSGTTANAGGVITSHTDLDYWSFTTGPGPITLTVGVPSYGNLDARAQLLDANGAVVVGWTNPSTSGSVTLTTAVAGGTYRLVVASGGLSSNATATNYGFNVGTYSISGTLAASPPSNPNPPSNPPSNPNPPTNPPANPPAGVNQTIGIFDPGSATWFLRDSNTPGSPSVTPFAYGFGANPVAGDWDGNGTSTIGIYHSRTATWYLRNDNSAGAPNMAPFSYGFGGAIPVVGDWDGDGDDTIGLYDPNTATWYLRNSNSAGAPSITPFAYGFAGAIPVVGDWDGNGTDTIGLYDPRTATWFLRNSTSSGAPSITPFSYGFGGTMPVAGDWDGNGTDTIGLYYPGTATWFLRNSNSPGAPSIAPFAYGFGSFPVVGAWDPAAAPASAAANDGLVVAPAAATVPGTHAALPVAADAAVAAALAAGLSDAPAQPESDEPSGHCSCSACRFQLDEQAAVQPPSDSAASWIKPARNLSLRPGKSAVGADLLQAVGSFWTTR